MHLATHWNICEKLPLLVNFMGLNLLCQNIPALIFQFFGFQNACMFPKKILLSPSSQYVTLPKTPCFSAISLYVLFLACLLLPQWHHLAIYPIFSSFAFQEDSSLWISPETWPSEWIRCQHGWGNYSCPCRNLDANRILCNATPAWNPCAMLTGKWNSF